MNANNPMTAESPVEEISEHDAAEQLAGLFSDEEGGTPVLSEESAPDDADDEDAEAEPEADEQETEVEEVEALGLEDLAETLGVAPDEVLDRVKIKIKVDGKETEVNLGELRSGYQREADYTRKTQELSARRKEIDEGVERLSQFEQIIHAELYSNPFAQAEQAIQQEMQSVDWSKLEQDDPYEATQRYQRLQRKAQEIAGAKQARAQQLQQLGGAIMQARQQHLASEVDRLREMLGWNGKEVQGKVSEMREFLKSEYEVPDAMLNSIAHAEFGRMVDDLMKLKRQSATKQSAEKKAVKRKVRVLKPGAPKPQKAANANADRLFQRAKKTQTDDAWADALAAKMGLI